MTPMAYPEDPDFSGIDALPDPASAPKLSTELDGIATAIQTTTTGISGTAGGKTPDEVVSEANAAAASTRDLATVAAAIESATKILKDAVAAWKKDAPKKKDLDAAQKAVDDAKAALRTAQESADKATDADSKYTADNAVAAAEKDMRSALLQLTTLQNKRKTADEAYEAARKRAVLVMKGVTTATDSSGEAPTAGPGTGTPAPSSGTGTGNGRTAPSSGTPAAPSSGKPAGTPSPSSTASPTSTSPTTSTSSTSSPDASTAAIAALLAQQGQAQQPVQIPTQQTTPTATAPQAQQQQPSAQQAKNGKTDGALDLDGVRELLGETGTGLALGLGGGSPSTSSVPSPAASEQHGTSFRPAGTPITGTGLGGAPAVNQQAPTTGNSATGLHTSSDVSGRSTPAATAFTPSPETKTSSATGTGTQSPAGQQQTAGRPMGSGMPMMPMTPMAGGAPAGAHRGGDGEEKKITTYGEGGLLHGEDTIAEAVRGGTIAQNRPDAAT